MIWWKPLLGAIIIIAGGLLFFLANPLNVYFAIIFLLPTILVGALYTWHWFYNREKPSA